MSMFTSVNPLVLASASPRRKELLGSLGLPFRIVVGDTPEPAPWPGENPGAYATRMAQAKGRAVAAREGLENCAVLAADTVVALEGDIMGKPKDHAEAFAMLKHLAGATHTVFTGCCLLLPESSGRAERLFSGKSLVSMWACPEEALYAYAQSEEPMDKAGAYAVQGAGAFLVSRIEGSWSNVVGLPLSDLVEVLLENGVIMPGGPA